MALEFKLPDIGEGIAEGEIVKWLVKVGDVVKEHQSIVEVMTDKATVEVPAPAPGKITKLHAKEGERVPVGSVLFTLDTAVGGASAAKSAPAPSTPAANASSSKASVSSSSANASSSNANAAKSSSAGAKPQPAAPAPAMSAPAANSARPTPTSGGSMLEFKLPDIGEGIAEGEIVKWLVKQGEVVKEHQSIVEVMTDKATVEVPSPANGTITKLNAKEGERVPVGHVLFTLALSGAAIGTAATKSAAAAGAASAATSSHVATASAARTPVLAGAVSASATPASVRRASDAKILAVPSARRVARELGVDLADVAGSGPHGVVRRLDVERFSQTRHATPAMASSGSSSASSGTSSSTSSSSSAPARPQFAPITVAPGPRETRIPFRGVRRKIAEAMVRSKFTAPHFTVIEEVDVTALVALREEAKLVGAESGVKITFMPFIMKACAMALAKYPTLNAHLDENSQEIVQFGYVNLGIAMDTEQGLIVPVLKEVQAKNILQLATELNELAERTRSGKVRPEDLRGSTFSITNAGNIGGTLATPIINFPDVAIMGVHRIMKKPGVVETTQGDRIEVRQYMNLSCSVDHRLADGADGARFLVYMKKLLEHPGLMAL